MADRGPMGIFEGYGDYDAGPDGTGERNPPAFPVQDRAAWQYAGMTLRDYFAVHADQPGVSEIVAIAGMVWSTNQVWHPSEPNKSIGSFDKWWADVPLSERLSLSAKVRFAMADAMLAARTTQGDA